MRNWWRAINRVAWRIEVVFLIIVAIGIILYLIKGGPL
jgi:hypothetical protein